MAYSRIFHRLGSALLAVLAAISLAGGTHQRVLAAPTAYYVSLTGRDTNPGTQAAPFRSFAKATSVLQPGDSLYIFGGTYNERLSVSNSGASGSPINIAPVTGAKVVIDLLSQKDDNVQLSGSYVSVRGLELRNSSGFCADLGGTHNTLRGSVVHDCYDMGIFTDGQDETIIGNTVYHASLKNRSLTMTGGWASGIKVRVGGSRIAIIGNRTFNNYGEGIAVTRGVTVNVVANVSYDNYSDNIYIDNSSSVLVARNFVFNHPNNGFSPNGVPANNISIGEEYYAGWGAQLSNIRVINNISFNGSHGVLFSGNSSGTPGGGLKNSVIAFNTLWGSINSEIYIVYDTGQSGNLIANNIVQEPVGKLVLLTNPSGVAFTHNFWVNVLPPLYARGAGDRAGNVRLATAPGYSAATFQLSSASPAINAGSAVWGVVNDFAAYSRPTGSANDMGAYEFPGP